MERERETARKSDEPQGAKEIEVTDVDDGDMIEREWAKEGGKTSNQQPDRALQAALAKVSEIYRKKKRERKRERE